MKAVMSAEYNFISKNYFCIWSAVRKMHFYFKNISLPPETPSSVCNIPFLFQIKINMAFETQSSVRKIHFYLRLKSFWQLKRSSLCKIHFYFKKIILEFETWSTVRKLQFYFRTKLFVHSKKVLSEKCIYIWDWIYFSVLAAILGYSN